MAWVQICHIHVLALPLRGLTTGTEFGFSSVSTKQQLPVEICVSSIFKCLPAMIALWDGGCWVTGSTSLLVYEFKSRHTRPIWYHKKVLIVSKSGGSIKIISKYNERSRWCANYFFTNKRKFIYNVRWLCEFIISLLDFITLGYFAQVESRYLAGSTRLLRTEFSMRHAPYTQPTL